MGGLLAVVNKSTGAVYIPAMDNKGTVYSYINPDHGPSEPAEVAKFVYDPYGRLMSKAGTMAESFPFGFQTKYYDSETSHWYYGYRFYDPATCKWLNRDSLGEAGGYNLFAFLNNDPVNGIDYLGCADAITTLIQQNPQAAEKMYTIYTLQQIKKLILNNATEYAKQFPKNERLKIFGEQLKIAAEIGGEIEKIEKELQVFISDAEYGLLTETNGTSWYGLFTTAAIQGVDGFGYRSLNEAFSKDTIFAREQSFAERVFKGTIGVIQIAGTAIPVGQLSGQILGKVALKFPLSVAAARLNPVNYSLVVRPGLASNLGNVSVKFNPPVIVIGEGMNAVKEAAKGLQTEGINAKWYQAWGKNFPTDRLMTPAELDAALERNARWIEMKIKGGYQIYDIGIDATRKTRSPFYDLEKKILEKYSYPTTPLSR